MQRKIFLILTIFFMTSNVFSMSKNSGNDIPKPKENFQAEIIDIDNVKTSGNYVSYNGKTYISAMKGSTQIYIPFEKIESLFLIDNEKVITQEGKEIYATITFKDGETDKIKLSSKDEITGQSSFGQFRIKITHLKKIIFKSENKKE